MSLLLCASFLALFLRILSEGVLWSCSSSHLTYTDSHHNSDRFVSCPPPPQELRMPCKMYESQCCHSNIIALFVAVVVDSAEYGSVFLPLILQGLEAG